MSEVKSFVRSGNMSRLAKKPLILPTGVEAKLDGTKLTVKGPKGELSRSFPSFVKFVIADNAITVTIETEERKEKPMLGTSAALARNMVVGVTDGYKKQLLIEGVGFKADAKGEELVMALVFSHPVIVHVPAGLKVVTGKGTIDIEGIDKELVGAFSADVRALKKPEPFKGKGIRYAGEIIRRKQGKKSA
jgi:large subunit ribosomal protein L6